MYLEGVRNISFVLLSQQHHHWSLCIVSFSEDFTSVHLYGKNCHLCRRQPPQMNTYLKAYNVSYPVTPLIRGCAGSQSRVFWCCLLLSSRLSVLPKSLPSQQKWQQDQKVCHFQALTSYKPNPNLLSLCTGGVHKATWLTTKIGRNQQLVKRSLIIMALFNSVANGCLCSTNYWWRIIISPPFGLLSCKGFSPYVFFPFILGCDWLGLLSKSVSLQSNSCRLPVRVSVFPYADIKMQCNC